MTCKVYFEAEDSVELVRLIMGVASIMQEVADEKQPSRTALQHLQRRMKSVEDACGDEEKITRVLSAVGRLNGQLSVLDTRVSDLCASVHAQQGEIEKLEAGAKDLERGRAALLEQIDKLEAFERDHISGLFDRVRKLEGSDPDPDRDPDFTESDSDPPASTVPVGQRKKKSKRHSANCGCARCKVG